MTESTTLLQQANGQRADAKRATFDKLVAKKPRRDEFSIELNGESLSLLYVAIGPTAYNKLVGEHQPTEAQLKRDPGANVNGDTFPPALLAAVCVEPELSVEQWTKIWNNENYTLGERGSLFWRANNLCNNPLDLTPFGSG